MRSSGKDTAGLDGTNVDDGALAAFRYQAPTEDLRRHPAAFQVDLNDIVPLLVRQLRKRDDGLDARIVDKDVDRSELPPGLCEQALEIATFGDVALDGESALAKFADF